MRLFSACLSVLGYGVFFARVSETHNLGLHGLSLDNPMGVPDLPEITEAFEATVHIRFREETKKFQSLFHWTTADQSESIYLGHMEKGDGPETKLAITRAGVTETCIATESLEQEQDYVLRFSVDDAGTAKIIIDGTLAKSCNNIGVPNNVTRDHLLGKSLLDGDGDHEELEGSITGLRITNNEDKPHHPSSAFKFLNFPGQSFAKGYVVSFYARYDDLSSGHIFQPVFDFGNGEASDNLWCGQREDTTRMSCEVYYGETADGHQVIQTEDGAIVEGEFAFWHAGLNDDGKFWIQKNGEEVAARENIPLPHALFRRNLLFSHDHWDGDDMLDGVVLGLRLDRLPAS